MAPFVFATAQISALRNKFLKRMALLNLLYDDRSLVESDADTAAKDIAAILPAFSTLPPESRVRTLSCSCPRSNRI